MYTYMLSLKDAFRMFDKPNVGVLKYDQFKSLVKQLSHIANEKCPSNDKMEKVFQFIDKNNDGSIEIIEWMESFGQFKYKPQTSVTKSGLKKLVLAPTQYRMTTVPPLIAYKNYSPIKSEPKNVRQKLEYNYVVKRINFNDNKHLPHVLRQPISNKNDYKSIQQNTQNYEASIDFDKFVFEIGRNKKILLENFEYTSKQTRLIYDVIKEIIESMFKNSGIYVKDDSWQMLIRFDDKEGIVDYKFLLDSYKDRNKKIYTHPLKQIE